MRFRLSLAFLCSAGVLMLSACDFSSGSSSSDPTRPGGVAPPSGGSGDCLESPFVTEVDGLDSDVCSGSLITLIGVNFSADLSQNSVVFRGANNIRVDGLPLQVVFPTDGNCSNGLESRLIVAVPGGVISGNLELRVNGLFAGGFGYNACPQLEAFELGRDGTLSALGFLGILGSFDQNAFIRLIGLNFQNLTEIRLEDSQGTTARIAANLLERNVGGTGANTGYARVGFALNDDNVEVRLLVQGDRDNVLVSAAAQSSVSNVVQVPVVPVGSASGTVLNGVKMPVGAVSGPVRIRYTMYDEVVNAAYNMRVEWRAVDTLSTSNDWFTAAPDVTDPQHDGIDGILPGPFAVNVGFDLLPVRGALRSYTWNPLLDPNFPPTFGGPIGGVQQPRVFPIEFRISPELATEGRDIPPPHSLITPSVLYFNLSDDALQPQERDQRAAIFEESFGNLLGADLEATTADWARPQGVLQGSTDEAPRGFGLGVEELDMQPPPRFDDPNDPNDGFERFFRLDTDRMTIAFVETLFNDPNDPEDDVTRITRFNRQNPGESLGEFHFTTMRVSQGTIVRGVGSRPLVIRLRGDQADPDRPVLLLEEDSVLDLNGEDGELAPRADDDFEVPGRGGAPGAGGGAGGDGGSLTLDQGGSVLAMEPAGDGGNDGGGGGETSGAIAPGDDGAVSRFTGGAGGGAGNREPGGQGDTGTPEPEDYKPSRPGRGGSARGNPFLLDLQSCAGSGGGGGGATLSVSSGAESEPRGMGGAGGGGGGGAVAIVGDGDFDILGRIEANGGDGGLASMRIFGFGVSPAGSPTRHGSPGAAGAGSGGAILLQSSGRINVACDRLSVKGGRHGISVANHMSDPLGEESTQNVIPGSGDGAPGWIRVEPTIGGTPSCIPFRAETLLAGSLSQSETISLFVADPSIFPDDGGTVAVIAMMIDPETGLEREFVEVIEYESVDFNEDAVLWNLLDLTRAVNGEGPFDWSGGIGTDTRVVYVGSPVTPAGVLDGDGVEPSPEQIEENAGREGEMSFPFVLSVDPQTQLPVLDPESGQPLSIYTMNTNSGVILEPDGGIFRSLTRANAGDPNRLDVSRLFIDNGVVLSVRGDLPLEIFVAEVADIAGRIDVSGEDGGLLRFDRADLTSPIPGDGGRGGPGGGPGGRGGDMTFRDGDPLNKAPENTIPVAGGTGQLPPGAPPEWGAPLGGNAGDDELAPPLEITLAQPGVGLRGTGCGETANPFPCTGITAGGGGGGGNGTNASAGVSQPDGSGRGGEPAGPFGVQGFRFGGEVWPFGGTGGAGGGASPHISEPYANGEAGDALNQGQALYAPATGGGGGGGALRLVADQLFLRATGELRARGGNAFQSIDLGGNGGGGGGGSILVQVRDTITVEPGGTMDVRGGIPNQDPPLVFGLGLPEYEGNIRLVGEFDQVLLSFGGNGGTGASGRIRIEADGSSLASNPELSSANNNFFSGQYNPFGVESVGVSQPIQLGVGRSLLVTSHDFTLGQPRVRYSNFGQPVGTQSVVLWEGAGQSLDVHASPGTFSSATQNVDFLSNTEYLRFRVLFLSDAESGQGQSIRSIELPFGLTLELPVLPSDEF